MHDEAASSPAKVPGAAAGAAKGAGSTRESAHGTEHMHAHSHKGGEHDVSDTPIGDVVSQHGAATQVFSEHDHDTGDHHVHTVHGQKHHHSDHEDARGATEQIGNALGHGGAEPYAGEETPDEEEAEKRSSIPGLSES